MCDYSLHSVASRPAKVGDNLVTQGFALTFTRGFAAVGEPNVAVCLLPGTEIAFAEEADWERPFAIFRRKSHYGKLVRFRRINADKSAAHHDAVEFPNGKIVLLTRLREGQRATVLQLPPAARANEPTQEHEVAHGQATEVRPLLV
jgi:hypothetical protein